MLPLVPAVQASFPQYKSNNDKKRAWTGYVGWLRGTVVELAKFTCPALDP